MLMLPILMYHKVEEIGDSGQGRGNYVLPDQFEEQIRALLSWGYTAITLDDWLRYREGCGEAPERPIALTFDDGYRSTFEIAWPILCRFGCVATVFVVADMMGQTNRWDSHEKQQPLLGGHEILLMDHAGIRFGSHSGSHRSLIDIPLQEAERELLESKMKLEGLLGRPVTSLAYPYNKQNSTIRALAASCGYRTAVVGRGRMNAAWTNPLMLRRIRVDLDTTVVGLGRLLERLRWLPGF
jgi:peptidoglycan/xylan/chitin deacetylase (PgdA/CDA1 family)